MNVFPVLRTVVVVGFGLMATVATAQIAGPDPKEIPVPRIPGPLGLLPGVAQLPVRPTLPEVLAMNDGTPVRTTAQWAQRREEMKRILEYYAVGQMPPPPVFHALWSSFHVSLPGSPFFGTV